MKPYPTYKDSGQPWLGPIPEHWKLMRAKWLFDELSEKNHPDKPLLSATQDKGVYPRELSENRVMMPMGELDGFKLVRPGEFVISLRSFEGGIEHSAYEGLISPAYTVLQRRRQLNDLYFKYLLKSDLYVQELNTAVTGIRDGQSIRYKDFGEARLPFPGLPEQTAIVAYLDHKTADIKRFITQKRQLIALLNEQKAAMINRAVTKGLNPDVPMKASGVEWLGGVPMHWTVLRFGFIVDMISGATPSKDDAKYWVGEIPWVSPKDMKKPEIFDSEDHISEQALQETSLQLIMPPVVLIVVRGMILARHVPVAVSRVALTINQDMKALRISSTASPEYLAFLLGGAQPLFANCIEESSHGTKCLRTDELKQAKLPLPPLAEQAEIVEFITVESRKINNAINRVEQEIELIQEYQTALISDAVTGKIDVRETGDAKNSAASLTT